MHEILKSSQRCNSIEVVSDISKHDILSKPSSMTNFKLNWKPPSGSGRKYRRNTKKYSFLNDDCRPKTFKSDPANSCSDTNNVSVNSESSNYLSGAGSVISTKSLEEDTNNEFASSKRSHSLSLSEIAQQLQLGSVKNIDVTVSNQYLIMTWKYTFCEINIIASIFFWSIYTNL